MRRIGEFLILAFIIISCSKDREKIFVAHMKRYTHYLSFDTAHYKNGIDIRYSFKYLNDSTILIKVYSYGDIFFKSIDYQNNKLRKANIDTLDYQRYYLLLKGSSKPHSTYYSSDINIVYDEYFNLDGERLINVGLDSLKIMSFITDFDGIVGELRIFFNSRFGIVALYSQSNFDATICRSTDDHENDKYRKELVAKLLADTTFFPFPRESYPKYHRIK